MHRIISKTIIYTMIVQLADASGHSGLTNLLKTTAEIARTFLQGNSGNFLGKQQKIIVRCTLR